MLIVSLDIGLFNLGFVTLNIDINNNITWGILKKVNIQDLTLYCRKSDCRFCHEKTFSDYIDHFCETYTEYLNKCDYILMERQPPQGFIVIQELILTRFRNKSRLISPNSVHKYYDIRGLDYDERKISSVKTAKEYCGEFAFSQINSPRQHDVADAVCQAIFFINEKLHLERPSHVVSAIPEYAYIHDSINWKSFEYKPRL